MKGLKLLLLTVWLTALAGCSDETATSYSVPATGNGSVVVDGQAETTWKTAGRITNFKNPWNPAVCPATSLAMMHDDDYLYCFFEANGEDELVMLPEITAERDIEAEDRVELFISADMAMNDYIGLEIDAKGRILSYQCRYYRRFDFAWEPPADVKAAGSIRPDGYSVELALPLAFVRSFARPDGCLYMGAYRAAFGRNAGKTVENWLCWINPHTTQPDFHVPMSLGVIKLETK